MRLDEDDPVAVALVDLVPGTLIDLAGLPACLTMTTAVPRGHKVTLRDLRAGALDGQDGINVSRF